MVAGSLFTKQLLWTPITAVNMTDIVSNQFKMSGASFAGTDTNGEPFKLRAASGRQEYGKPDIIFLESVSGTIVRRTSGERITDNIRANRGRYDRRAQTVTLSGNVRIDSSNGDKILTDELVVRL